MNSNDVSPVQRPHAPGSVKAARERMEALKRRGDAPIQSQPTLEPRAFQEPRSVPSPRFVERLRQPMPAALQDARNGPGIGAVISRPIPQSPQWPLNDQTVMSTPSGFDFRDFTPPSSVSSQGQKQFARPNLSPPMFEPEKRNNSYNKQVLLGRQVSNNYSEIGSSIYGTPLSPPSRAPSEVSSMGSIPDFPMAQVVSGNQFRTRDRGSLGPPPSARRIPPTSSFYTNASYVPPIPEESERTKSRESYASSSAIPSSWGDESPGFQFGYETENQFSPDLVEELDQEPRVYEREDDGTEGLVRSASIGTRSRPKLVMTRSSYGNSNSPRREQDNDIAMAAFESLEDSSGLDTPSFPFPRSGVGEQTHTPMADEQSLMQTPFSARTEDDYPLSQSGSIPIMMGRSLTSDSATLGTLAPPRMSQLFPPDNLLPRLDLASVPKGFSSRSTGLRTPRLQVDIDAVHEAEKRGSLTSLPDLIRRATRLVWLIDKNNRPGSRLNDLYVYTGQETPRDELSEKSKTTSPDTRRTSGLSGMLSAFPPPGTVSSVRNSLVVPQRRPVSTWPEGYAQSDDATESRSGSRDQKGVIKGGRRCCGLPLRAFIALMIFLLLVIAAAIIVPLELLVFNKNTSDAATTASTSPDLSTCQSTTMCANGGTIAVANGVCTCVCIDGFVAPTCTTKGAGMCTTMPMSVPTTNSTTGTTMNVTLGNGIDRLIAASQKNFSIPLNATLLVAKFAAVNLSCSAQNSLITFDGSSGPSAGSASDSAIPSSTVVPASSQPPVTQTSIQGSSSQTATRVTGIVPVATISELPVLRDRAIAGQETNIIEGPTIQLSILINHVSTTSYTPPTSHTLTSFPPTTTTSPTTFTINIIPTTTIQAPSSCTTIISKMTLSSLATLTTQTQIETTTSSSPTTSSTKTPSTTSLLKSAELLDFARVVTLLIFQIQTFDAAVSAQTFIQTFFNGAVNGGFSESSLTKAGNLSIGNGNSVDFMTESVVLVGVGGGFFGGGRSGTT